MTLTRSKLRTLALPLLAALAMGLVACSPQDAGDKTASTASAAPADPYEAVAAQGKGFTVGAMMSAHTVYVLFDPQCPHCGRLWEASLPLMNKARFVWMPVNFGNPKSLPQGAALLAASNPAETMSAHEKSLLAGTGGMAASASVPAELAQAIKNNTELLTRLGVASVPYLLARNQSTGQLVAHTGAMDTPALAALLGMR